MIDYLYQIIQQAGYVHPLHPAFTHLPIGCIMAAGLFSLISSWARKPAFFQTARHCIGLALLILPLTAVVGYLDWQHYYAGALIWPIKVKIALAGALYLCLILAIILRRNRNRPGVLFGIIFTVCLVLVSGIGYYGGELVYGSNKPVSEAPAVESPVRKGEALFMQKCAICHYHDRVAVKVGPGLKGLAHWTNMPASNWPLSDETLRKQIVTPYKEMPAFTTFSSIELDQLIAYLKTL